MREDEGEDLRREVAQAHRDRAVVFSSTCAPALPLALSCWALRIVATGLAACIHAGGFGSVHEDGGVGSKAELNGPAVARQDESPVCLRVAVCAAGMAVVPPRAQETRDITRGGRWRVSDLKASTF